MKAHLVKTLFCSFDILGDLESLTGFLLLLIYTLGRFTLSVCPVDHDGTRVAGKYWEYLF